MTRYRATMPPSLPWGSQVVQYAHAEPPAEPGITYYAGDMSDAYPGTPPVDCLLSWDHTASGTRLMIVGILNHYPADYPPWERKGRVNVWIRPSHKRRGIGTALVREAASRWDIDPDRQRYTAEGAAFAERLAAKSSRG